MTDSFYATLKLFPQKWEVQNVERGGYNIHMKTDKNLS
jgi:hypothetical protein